MWRIWLLFDPRRALVALFTFLFVSLRQERAATKQAPWRYGWRSVWTRSINLSCGLAAGNAPATPVPSVCSVPLGSHR